MDINQIINPSTTLGAFIIGFMASFLAGFLTGKSVEKKKYVAKSEIEGDRNVVIQNSNNK